jgi:hypothetical protein
MDTGERGTLSEAKILAAFVTAGYAAYLPFGAGYKCDLVVDDGDRLWRIQCKTGRVRNGTLLFNAYSQSGNGGTKADYQGLVDFFAVLNPDDDKVYLVPVGEVGKTSPSLRLIPTTNNQVQGIRWAEPYLLKPVKSKCKETVSSWAS